VPQRPSSSTDLYPGYVSEPIVSVVMGSDSDLPVMNDAVAALQEFGIPHEVKIVSAHRTPRAMIDFAAGAAGRGIRVIIAGAGGAAHLPGMIASVTTLPVIGVPVPLKNLDGLDSLLSIVQMPAGIPVATVAIGNARNAGILAARILASGDEGLTAKLAEFAAGLEAMVADKNARLADGS
jgi:5-(carboxyamino)imidazole ribonucleotide mutase